MQEVNLSLVREIINTIGTAIEGLDNLQREEAEKRWLFEVTRFGNMPEQRKMLEQAVQTVEEQVRVAKEVLAYLSGNDDLEQVRLDYMHLIRKYNVWANAVDDQQPESEVARLADEMYAAARAFDVPSRSAISLA